MSIFLQPLQTVTVGSGAPNTISFTNIPQTYTDLVVKMSGRSNQASSPNSGLYIYFNNDSSSIYSATALEGNSSSSASYHNSSIGAVYYANLTASSATANTFANIEMYMPNYTSSNYKSVIVDSVSETNSGTAYQDLIAGLYRSTNAITSIYLSNGGQTLAQYSEFSLYGVLRQGI